MSEHIPLIIEIAAESGLILDEEEAEEMYRIVTKALEILGGG